MKAKKITKETVRELGIVDREFPKFNIGDMVAVSQWVIEGKTKRLQVFEGNVIAMHKKGASSTFTVRKQGANDVYVERIYPFYSPIVDSIKLVFKAKVRRAKLYYLRDRIGKAAQIRENVERRAKKKTKPVAKPVAKVEAPAAAEAESAK
jgi:large subunit ribosomal protein L19